MNPIYIIRARTDNPLRSNLPKFLLAVLATWLTFAPSLVLAQGSQYDSSFDDQNELDRYEQAGMEPASRAPQLPHSKSPGTLPNQQVATIRPFGANLFDGNFLKTREDGQNPNYLVMSGDRVAVYTWGSIQVNNVFVVDGQGNIFLPDIGPVKLEGVKNRDLTSVVRSAIRRVYFSNFNVYTNLIGANPVAVYVTGSVVSPGRYAGIPSDSPLFFLDQAGGINWNLGSFRQIVMLRNNEEFAKLDLYDFIMKGKIETPQFQDGDTILVLRRGPVVVVQGDVAAPALVEFKDEDITGAKALEIIPKASTATAVTIEGTRNGLPYNNTLSVSAFRNILLVDGDSVMFRDDGRAESIIVHFEGEFDGPSMMSVKRGSRLVDVLNLVPVNPELADTDAVHVRRLSVARAQKEAIDDSLFRLERSALLALSHSTGESAIRIREAELTAKFVERARLIDPLGRVVTRQDKQQMNVLLENGDIIAVPQKTNVVRIGGEVMMSQAVMHRPGMEAKDYVRLAGGYSDRGDDGVVIVLHADASVSMDKPDIVIQPGDEILVPPRVDVKWLQNATDVMQIIYQVAMSAAVILAL